MKPPRRVEVTANFERNLEELERFLDESDASSAFDTLLTHLAEELVPNLVRFPGMGRSFFERASKSVQGVVRLEALRERTAGKDLRELLTGDYLLLYLDDGRTLYLLSIRHHRQLSYDFAGHWR